MAPPQPVITGASNSASAATQASLGPIFTNRNYPDSTRRKNGCRFDSRRDGYRNPCTDNETRREVPLGIGTSILLFAVGAILRYAVTATVSGVDLDVVGLILMIVGVVGLVLSLFWMVFYADRVRERRVVGDPVDREVVHRDVV
jgi:hypothetical protein